MLDINQLSKVKYYGGKIIAQCPACAEEGRDQKGQHLFVTPKGEFGCVLYPGDLGHGHRQKIHALVGIKEKHIGRKNVMSSHKRNKSPMSIKPAEKPKPMVIQKNILGHLGRLNETHARKEVVVNTTTSSLQRNSADTVPNVPENAEKILSKKLGLDFVIKDNCVHFEDGVIYKLEEIQRIQDIDDESLKKIHHIKKLFNGNVVAVSEKNK